MNIQINISKRHLYAFGLLVVLALGALFVSGYNSGASPAVFGHSAEEIAGLNNSCTGTQRLTSNGTAVTCATDSDYCRSGSCGAIAMNGNYIRLRDSGDNNHLVRYDSGLNGVLINGYEGVKIDVSQSSSELLVGNNGIVTITGEIDAGSIRNDGANRCVCIKSDGRLGTCTCTSCSCG